MVFRNEVGAIIKIYTFRIGYYDPLVGEITTLWYGAMMAHKLEFKNVIFQCDSSNAVSAVKRKCLEIQSLHHNIQDLVHNFLSAVGILNLWEAVWIPRLCNGVAHFMAQ
uniref:RNase H type-1 domain-containing protein n=1 Tax=Cannabis sativa TaxID=3483 RepID=A0A803P3A7_CANSA